MAQHHRAHLRETHSSNQAIANSSHLVFAVFGYFVSYQEVTKYPKIVPNQLHPAASSEKTLFVQIHNLRK